MPNDLLAELAQLDNIVGVKQANADNLAQDRRPRRSTPATTTCSPTCSTWASRAGSSSPATSFGDEMRRMVDEPERRREIDAEPAGRLPRPGGRAAGLQPIKAALNLLGLDVGGPRLPYVELDERRDRRPCARCSSATGCSQPRRRVSGTLRVLPLGGLGEIGKNMTVVEYDGRIVVVDTGLRFPTADMLGHRPRAARLHLPARARRGHRGDRHHPRPRGPPRRAAVGAARARRSTRRRRSTAAG